MTRPQRWQAIYDLLPGILFAASLAFFCFHLRIPEGYIYDEVYHAYTASEYVRGNPDAYVWDTTAPRPGVAYMWNHPPVGVWMIAAGIKLWGNNSFGWRFAAAVFGAAGIALAYLLALRLTGRRGVALLAASLLVLDGLYFVQSRTGMLDIFGTFFMMAALLAFHRYLTAQPEREGRELAWCGLFLGLAVATKWSAAYPSACVGLVVLWRTLFPSRERRRATAKRSGGVLSSLGSVAIGLGMIPAAVYVFSYIPFFLVGHDWSQFVELQRQTLYYHSHLRETHAYASAWWSWPLALRPVWYYVAYLDNWISNIYTNSNPLLSVMFVPAAIMVTIAWWKSKNPAWLALLIGFFGQWLPWGLVPRIAFAYHFLPATPFGCIAVAALLGMLWNRGPAARGACIACVIAVAAAFVFFYPIYAAVPLKKEAFELRMWLPTWR